MTRKSVLTRLQSTGSFSAVGSPVMVDVTECDQCGRVWDERTAPRPGVEIRRFGLTSLGDQLAETRTFCDTTCASIWLAALDARKRAK